MRNRINREWLDACRVNEQPADGYTVESWVGRLLNCDDVRIEDDGTVWANRHWLSQDEIDMACRLIERGLF